MRIATDSTSMTFRNERDTSETLDISYNNWGEPYAEGARMTLQRDDKSIVVDLERAELQHMHDFIGRLLKTMR